MSLHNKINHICLISQKRHAWSKTPWMKKELNQCSEFLKAWYTPSLSLLTIAALTPAKINISIIDENFDKINFNEKYDIVGISAMTQEVVRAYEIADEFRKRGVYTVMGGIHVSVLPEEALGHVDTVIIGEAENLWPKFLEDYQHGEPRKIYRETEGYFIDLKNSPIPRYDLLIGKDYFMDPKHFSNSIPIQVSRGCPHNCDFCLVTKMYGYKFRKKTMAQVKSEILTSKKYFPGRMIMFSDDNIFLDRKYAKELLQVLKDLKVRYWAQSDISIGQDDELLKAIYESGCLYLLIGFESISSNNLKNINSNLWKYRQLKNYSKYIENIQKHGIIVFGSFIFGLEHDDNSVFKKVVEFMNKNNITGQLTIATPLPGSRLYEKLKSEKRLIKNDGYWEKCTFLDVVFKPNKISVKELEEGFVWAYKQIFNKHAFVKRAKYLNQIYKNMY
jgi:radical SAM superfamily enzyme YgiQ (UPF0313 family)